MDRMIKPSQIEDVTGLSMSTIWRREKEGSFPKRRKISQRRVGWLASEVEQWLNSREVA